MDSLTAVKPELENPSKFQIERKQSSSTSQIFKGCDLDRSNHPADRHSRTMSVGDLPIEAARSDGLKKDDSAKGVAIDIPQSLSPLSVEQETIDVEKSDFCLSSSDNEISPRPMKMADIKPVKDHGLVVMTKSPTVQSLQTPPCNSLSSGTETPFSPGSAKRLWKREIRKSLFRTRNTNASSPPKRHEIAGENVVCENGTLQGEASPVEISQEDASLWKDGRSKSVHTLGLNEMKEKEKEVEQSTSQLIRLLWARWTGGSSRGKRIPNNTSEGSLAHPCKTAKTPESTPNSHYDLSLTKSPCKDEPERFPILGDREEISAAQELSLCPAPKAPSFTENPLPRTLEVEKEIAAVETPAQESRQPDPQELRMKRPTLVVPDLQVVLDSAETDTQEGGPPEAEIETPKPAIAR